MLNILTRSTVQRRCAWLIALLICLGGAVAMADYTMPVMPAPTSSPVYWRLTSIEQTPEVRASGGYSIHYDVTGLDVDLGDGLLTESLLQGDDVAQGITLVVERNDQIVMEHSYLWTPLPIYIESGESYPIDVTGILTAGGTTTPNSLLGMYVQGEIVARISAGSYTSHSTSSSFDISAESGVYRDGSLVVSIILRDANDMFRNRIAYTYTMEQGIKPVPTPVPGFAPVAMDSDVEVPAYFEAVEGQDGLWRIVTAPDQYRAYGSMSGSQPTFFPADENGEVVMNERPSDHAEDFANYVKGFVAAEPDALPDIYAAQGDGLYVLVSRDGDKILRAYGRVDGEGPDFYAVDESGIVDAENAAPIKPNADFATYIKGFGAADAADQAPYYYDEVSEGLYAFTSRDGEKYMRAYGRLNGAEPAFYETDEDGKVSEDAKPVMPEDDFAAYIEGFDTAKPKASDVPAFYEPQENGVYAIEGRDGTTEYRVYGVKDGKDAAFYPADAEGNIAEDAEPIDEQTDFENHVAGFEPVAAEVEVPDFYQPTETEGVWAFTDKDEQTQYRTYGKLNRGNDASFYPSDEAGAVSSDALPVEPASDRTLLPTPPFTPMIPENFPPFYLPVEATSLYSFVDLQGNTVYRVYGAYGDGVPQFYPADAEGNPIENAPPIDPEEDYQTYFGTFEVTDAEEIPSHYEPVEGKAGLYSFTNRQNQKVYRVYGKSDTTEPGFFPADAEGRITSGLRIDPETDVGEQVVALTNAVVTPEPPAPTNTAIVRESTPATSEPVPTEMTSEIATDAPKATQSAAVTSVVSTPEATEMETEAPTEEPATEAPTETAQPIEEETTAPTEAPVETETAGGGTPWVIIIAGVAVVVVGGGIYLATRKKKK